MKGLLFLVLSLLLPSLSFAKDDSITTTCIHVVDGDTIVISSGDKVKLIGIDAPEFHKNVKLITKTLGQKAWDFTKDRLKGKEIKLEFDPNNEYANHRDKYGRLLAYVYYELPTIGAIPFNLRANGRWVMFNAQIIAEGYVYVYTKYPFKYIDEFKKYEQEARENNRGLWAEKNFQ